MNPYRGIYNKNASDPWKISRSKIDLFIQCKRCFWLEARKGIKRPSMPPFLINSTIDALFKKEFDVFREKGEPHGLQTEFGVDAIPAQHENINMWRENFKGIQFHHKPTNLYVFGAIDDLWINPAEEYIVVDYKATAKNKKIDHLDDTKWHDQYRRQMEVYQWLLRQNGLKVSDTGYFVYANGRSDVDSFDGKVEFDIEVFPYTGKDDWVEPILDKIKAGLENDSIPEVGNDCEHCAYAKSRTQMTLESLKDSKMNI